MKATAIVTLCALGASGCYTSSVIRTDPPGAKVYVQWQYAGLSPVKLRLKDGFIDGTRYYVRVEKTGYKKQEAVLAQDISAGGIVADVLLLVPTLFFSPYLCALNCQRHRAAYDFVLEPDDAAAAAVTAAAPR
jgi:PEGA domain